MKFYNLKNKYERMNFIQATNIGIGSKQGLFFPKKLPKFTKKEISSLLKTDFIYCSAKILSQYIGKEISFKKIFQYVKKSFFFPIPLKRVENNIFCLELFHGPTLAFKDFGAQFMAQMINIKKNNKKSTIILTATSGDTGAAVAHAFYKMNNVKVVILYPKGKISFIQEKIFCTLGKNIYTISINGNFDTCQNLVKRAFQDQTLKNIVNINSANSINVSRLFAQICYYFEAVKKVPQKYRNQLVFSVPSGNFGNLTAGYLAKSLGLPIKKFIIASNINDTVPRYLQTGIWNPKKTIETLSNSMDINKPNNWPRIQELFRRKNWRLSDISYSTFSDQKTKQAIFELNRLNYVADPHTAIAWMSLKQHLKPKEIGIFLGTAHPVKFNKLVESLIKKTIPISIDLEKKINLPFLSINMDPNFDDIKNFLINISNVE
ncbi:threonine synthase [Candidatus Tachikawaea gelatinosa]|uniref:Threonine synthase n=1 Tax=Candidatus Tachikawaea gelatinosa TaxID=1410383 RepID=A0A090AR21_9ENTR|nr:threonine synthase [Candidatus Tachikawaea gelatinosa]BAP58792.1 threonine synthase ThrC [Candidatus Tachikawaea gelatinosa]